MDLSAQVTVTNGKYFNDFTKIILFLLRGVV